ncbi:oligoribonuclease [Buchnera aphidicola (Aphis craccivora)]|uniref:Oligoribonuclease n=1 Tax=Buchnera aphidicola (Aphis craccivora) TaxID=466616 RepID=A0A4D6XSP0_9GAMM|nr:oligoribonuclease [Buchnera aphidicola]QCI16791.1 oligoribonuclease [Buchnera aphidicola (Aphis craccivora)]WAI17763.1 MAG: oligoribonuclease [Buchnera aphidicola (Aphis craccivora)]
MKFNNKNLIWIDLEMTGLNPKIHRIIEIATLITDAQLNIISKGPVIAINQKEKHILLMNEWNQKTHMKTGLIERVKQSTYNEFKAESKTILFLKQWVPLKSSPICGNSIYQDRKFLNQYMPNLENYFHYRCIDVSTIKELVSRWHPKIKTFKKKKKHTALDDIQESIMELNFYKKIFFNI